MVNLLFGLSSISVIALAGRELYRTYRSTGGDLLHRIYLFLFGYVSVYVLSLSTVLHYVDFSIDTTSICWIFAIPTIGLICIIAGYRWGLKFFGRWAAAHINREPDLKRMLLLGFALVALAVSAELYFIYASGGYQEYFSSARGKGDVENTIAYIYEARWLLLPGIAILLAARIKYARNWLSIAIVLIILLGLVYNFWLGQRSGIFGHVFALLAAARIMLGRKPSTPSVLVAFLAATILIGFIKQFRTEFYLGSDFARLKTFIQQPILDIVQASVLTHFEGDEEHSSGSLQYEGDYSMDIKLYTDYVALVPQLVNYDYGVFYLQHFVKWIPRLVWPDRPDFREEKKKEFETLLGTSHYSTFTPTILGMYWMHFGVISVVFLSLFTGLFYSFFDAHGRASPYTNPICAVFFLSTVGSGAGDVIGLGPLFAFEFWAPFVAVPLWIFFQFCTRPTRRGHLATESALAPVHGKTF